MKNERTRKGEKLLLAAGSTWQSLRQAKRQRREFKIERERGVQKWRLKKVFRTFLNVEIEALELEQCSIHCVADVPNYKPTIEQRILNLQRHKSERVECRPTYSSRFLLLPARFLSIHFVGLFLSFFFFSLLLDWRTHTHTHFPFEVKNNRKQNRFLNTNGAPFEVRSSGRSDRTHHRGYAQTILPPPPLLALKVR